MSAAQEYRPISSAALASFQAHRAEIIQLVVARALERRAEVVQHGAQAESVLTAGIGFTTQMLETALQLGDPALLDYQLQWARDRLPHDGVRPRHVLSRLQIYAQVVAELLPAEHAAPVNAFVHWMIERQTEIVHDNV